MKEDQLEVKITLEYESHLKELSRIPKELSSALKSAQLKSDQMRTQVLEEADQARQNFGAERSGYEQQVHKILKYLSDAQNTKTASNSKVDIVNLNYSEAVAKLVDSLQAAAGLKSLIQESRNRQAIEFQQAQKELSEQRKRQAGLALANRDRLLGQEPRSKSKVNGEKLKIILVASIGIMLVSITVATILFSLNRG